MTETFDVDGKLASPEQAIAKGKRPGALRRGVRYCAPTSSGKL